ncbi:hypothetical protein K435DRAFT_247848 [Dendrothele bispora CBS 962.96]|uniref:Uncharacterized protein n=1 Tax=Dendrothele bispora (strain CBS 962.96) TaxID=1314807 RepID=A0A4S8MLN1_DENBC|nr:hypothetical protein K435DRAFT_247848 [Dendrothele bispora CBS 962.96]
MSTLNVLVINGLNGLTRTRLRVRNIGGRSNRSFATRSRRGFRHVRYGYTDGEALRRVHANTSSWAVVDVDQEGLDLETSSESTILSPRQSGSSAPSISSPNWSALVSGTAFWMLSPSMVQGVAASKVCTTSESGEVKCQDKLSPGTIAAIVVTIVLVISLIIAVIFIIRRTRRRRREAVQSAQWIFQNRHSNKYDQFERPELGLASGGGGGGGSWFLPNYNGNGGIHDKMSGGGSQKIWSAPGTARSIHEKQQSAGPGTAGVIGSGTVVDSGGVTGPRSGLMDAGTGTGTGTGKANHSGRGDSAARSGGPWSAALAWRGFRNWSWMTRSAPGDKMNFRVDPYRYDSRSGAESSSHSGKFEEIDIRSGEKDEERYMSVETGQIEGPKGWEGKYEKFNISLASAPPVGGTVKNAWSGGRGSSLRRNKDATSGNSNSGYGSTTSRSVTQTKATSASGTNTTRSAEVSRQASSAGVSQPSRNVRDGSKSSSSIGRQRSKSGSGRDTMSTGPPPPPSIPSQFNIRGSQSREITPQPHQSPISVTSIPPQLSSAVAIAQAAVRRAEMSPQAFNGIGSGGSSSLGRPPKLKTIPAALTAVISGPDSATIRAPSSPLVASVVTAKDINGSPSNSNPIAPQLPPIPKTPSIPVPLPPQAPESSPSKSKHVRDLSSPRIRTRSQYEEEMFGYF